MKVKHPKDWPLFFDRVNLSIEVDELVEGNISPDVIDHYIKLRRKEDLYLEAYMRGWQKFDWQRAAREKWFSPNDLEMFHVEIHGYDPKEVLQDGGILTG